MKHLVGQKNILRVVLFLTSVLTNVAMAPQAMAFGRTCGDLFQDNLLSSHELLWPALAQKVDRVSLAVASALTESVASQMVNPAEFTRFVQLEVTRRFEANLNLMYNQRRELYDFLVDPKSQLRLDQLGELLSSTSQIQPAKNAPPNTFILIPQDTNVFFEVAIRLKQNRRALH